MIKQFVKDVRPLLYGRRVNYVDVGAYRGDVMATISEADWGGNLEAHLIEPNPESYAELEKCVEAINAPPARQVQCHNLAFGSKRGTLRFRSQGTRTQVLPPGYEVVGDSNGFFEAEVSTLDVFCATWGLAHISILKIDVEGHEGEVLQGGEKLLASQAADILYIEAGMDPENSQQLYYRKIEDILIPQRYRLFRIYEQVNEWQTDSPLLRRVNLAFMSEAFATQTPFHLSKKLFELRKKTDETEAALSAASEKAKMAQVEKTDLRKELEALRVNDERAKARIAELESKIVQREKLLSERAQEITELRSAIQGAEENLAKQDALIQAKDVEISERLAAAKETRRHVKELQAQISTSDGALAAKNAEIAALQAAGKDAKQRIKELQAQNEKINSSVSKKDSEIAALKAGEKEVKRERDEIVAQKAELDLKISKRDSEIAALKARESDTQRQINEFLVKIAEQDASIAEKDSENILLKSALSEREADSSQAKEKSAELNQNLHALEDKYEKELSKLREELAGRKKELEKFRREAQYDEKKIEQLRKEKKQSESALKENTFRQKAREKEYEAKIATLQAQLESRSAMLQAKSVAVESQTRFLKETVSYRLGGAVLDAFKSPSKALALPSTIWRLHKDSGSRVTHKALREEIAKRGPQFLAFVQTLQKSGLGGLREHFASLNLSVHAQVDALSALSKESSLTPLEAIEVTREAQALDPKPYRAKWLAFRLAEHGHLAESAELLLGAATDCDYSESEKKRRDKILSTVNPVRKRENPSVPVLKPEIVPAPAPEAAPARATKIEKGVDIHGPLFQRGLKLLDERNYVELHYLRITLLQVGDAKSDAISAYLNALELEKQGAYAAALQAIEAMVGNSALLSHFGASEIRGLRLLRVKLLGRLGKTDVALKELESLPSASDDSAKALSYIDLVRGKQPDLALQQFERLKSTKASIPFNYRLLEFYLRILKGADAKLLDEIQTRLSNSQSERQRAEFALVLSNLAISRNDSDAHSSAVNRFWKEYGLEVPKLVDNKAPFSLANIENRRSSAASGGPLVSIVMTSFNSAKTIAGAIDSLLAQTHSNIEVIVVDDCSTDGTQAVLEAIVASDKRVKVLRNALNVGTYNSKNRGIVASKGDFLTCHDSDDWAHPRRIELHLEEMAKNPSLVATRSSWIRLSDDGRYWLTRWAKNFLHENPASTFVRRSVFERTGLFDTVRVGADNEFWHRLTCVFGRGRLGSIKKPLSIGLRHGSSLTTSGVGAYDDEMYSAVRDAYTQEWIKWHRAKCLSDEFFLPNTSSRAFPAPKELVPENLSAYLAESFSGDPVKKFEILSKKPAIPFVFGIPFSAASNGQWEHRCMMLGNTLQSLLNQSHSDFRILICGHEEPNIKEMKDSRVEWIRSDIAPPADSSKYRMDKKRKRTLLSHRLRQLGGGYFMFMDADDLLHKDLVSYAVKNRQPHGYAIRHGYAMDWQTGQVAPVPGVWGDVTFDQICGSCTILNLSPEDLPEHVGKSAPACYYDFFASHAYWRTIALEHDRPLQDVPFPAAIYVLNHSFNLSFSIQRNDCRQINVCRNISKKALKDLSRIRKNFCLPTREAAPVREFSIASL